MWGHETPIYDSDLAMHKSRHYTQAINRRQLPLAAILQRLLHFPSTGWIQPETLTFRVFFGVNVAMRQVLLCLVTFVGIRILICLRNSRDCYLRLTPSL